MKTKIPDDTVACDVVEEMGETEKCIGWLAGAE